MYCRNCGSEVHEKAIACPKCGVPPFVEKKFCQECGGDTKENQLICVKCGVKLTNKGSGSQIGSNLNFGTSKLTNGLSIQRNIPALIVSILMFISAFFPWYSASASGWDQEIYGSVNALQSTWGLFAFIATLGAIALSFIKFKWNLLAGVLSLIFSLIFILDVPNMNGGGYGFEAHIGPAWGIFVFMSLSIIYTVLNIKTLKDN